MNPYRRFLWVFAAVLGGALLVVALLNVMADPYEAWGTPVPRDWPRYRNANDRRATKAEMLRRHAWDVVCIGSSRVECGLRPDDPAWDGRSVYNCGLSGTSLPELLNAARLALANPGVHTVLLCLDEGNFETVTALNPEYAQSRFNPELNVVEYRLRSLLGWASVRKSIQSVTNYLGHKPARETGLGLRSPGAEPLEYQANFFSRAGRPPRGQPVTLFDECFARLAAFLAEADGSRVRLRLVLLPLHAVGWEFEEQSNVRPLREEWIRRLVEVVVRHNRDHPAKPVELWDFDGFTALSTEPVPAEGSRGQMTWWSDPYHFKPALGSVVLARLTGHRPPAGVDADGFGMVLTGKNVEAFLAGLRRGQEAAMAAHPEFRAGVRRALMGEEKASPDSRDGSD